MVLTGRKPKRAISKHNPRIYKNNMHPLSHIHNIERNLDPTEDFYLPETSLADEGYVMQYKSIFRSSWGYNYSNLIKSLHRKQNRLLRVIFDPVEPRRHQHSPNIRALTEDYIKDTQRCYKRPRTVTFDLIPRRSRTLTQWSFPQNDSDILNPSAIKRSNAKNTC